VSWWDRAGCLGMNTELFYPQGTTGRALDQANQAKAVCARCPVAKACLEWAVKTGEDAGVWGGTTEDERRILRRQRQRQRQRKQQTR
jgi:WhiB family redox-sensing transcriptional regulator